jgi:CheY-like chemotaxis protein
MDGFKAAALLRGRGWQKPIIAITAQSGVEGKDEEKYLHFDGFLSKPIWKEDLVAAVEKFSRTIFRKPQNESSTFSDLALDMN